MLIEGHAASEFVSCSPEGKYVRKTKIRACFREILKAVELPRIRFHDLRHGFATMQLEAGVNPRTLQERIGHANIPQTLGTYSHVTKSASRAAADKIEDALFSGQQEPPAPPAKAAGALFRGVATWSGHICR